MKIEFSRIPTLLRILFALSFLFVVTRPVTPVLAWGSHFITPDGDEDCTQAAPSSLNGGLSAVNPGSKLYAAVGTHTMLGNQVVNHHQMSYNFIN
jgi:hypothetical protein